MAGSLKDKRIAEEGYRVVKAETIQRRETFALAEKRDPATAWLQEHDTRPREIKPGQPGAGVTWIERKKAKRRAASLARAQARFYTCAECSYRWSARKILNPPPKRCVLCQRSWRRHLDYVATRRHAVRSKRLLHDKAHIVFTTGDVVTWESRTGRGVTSRSIERTGVVAAVVGPGIPPIEALERLGIAFSSRRADSEVAIDFLRGGRYRKPPRALSWLTYLVDCGGKIFRPHIHRLRAATPVVRSLGAGLAVRSRRTVTPAAVGVH